MWPFKNRTAPKDESPALRERVKQLELALDDLQHDQRRLAEQHLKLSGRYYARFGKGLDESGTLPAAPQTKDELRRLAGIVAGRPTPHR